MADPHTPRRSLFAVWHWPRWVWCVIVAAMPVLYFLSAPVVDAALYKTYAFHKSFELFGMADTFYAPAWWCNHNSETLSAIHDLEWMAMGYDLDDLPYMRAELVSHTCVDIRPGNQPTFFRRLFRR